MTDTDTTENTSTTGINEEDEAAIAATLEGDGGSDGKAPNVVPISEATMDFPAPMAATAVPEWVELPPDAKIPQGAQVGFMKFNSGWTMDQNEHNCVMWSLTDQDERVAFMRIQDNIGNAVNELSMQMLRYIDGVKVNWGATRGESGCAADFWTAIGPKCRQQLVRYHSRTHNMNEAEVAYFLENCVVVLTMT